MVANGHGRAFGHQHHRGRFADDFRMSDHHNLEALHRETRPFDKFDACCRRTGCKRHIGIDDIANRRGVHAFDVFERVDCRLQRPDVKIGGHGAL